ncbi:hypothetical protein PILCRDRAFT_810613, partial [Piloderma croceum F 1598]
MSGLAPLDIELTNFNSPPSPISSDCSSISEPYIPVYRRKIWSEVSPVSSVASSPSSSSVSMPATDMPIYNADDLILLSRSPLAQLSAEDRSHLREAVPEIVTGRRQRTGLESRKRRSREEKRTGRSAKESRADQAVSWRRSNIQDTI